MENDDKNCNSNFLPKVIIEFNHQWEVRNWYDTCTKEVIYGLKDGKTKFDLGDIPPKIVDIVTNASSDKEAINLISKELDRFIANHKAQETMLRTIDRAKKRWDEVSNKYFILLSETLDIPINEFEKQYYAFFTFGIRCPFHQNMFMFNQYMDFADMAMHEIMHIEFLKKYKQHCLDQGLDFAQVSHLKEILTVILNSDMSQIMTKPDYGYAKHQTVRKEVMGLYQQAKKSGKNFLEFLDLAINVVKSDTF